MGPINVLVTFVSLLVIECSDRMRLNSLNGLMAYHLNFLHPKRSVKKRRIRLRNDPVPFRKFDVAGPASSSPSRSRFTLHIVMSLSTLEKAPTRVKVSGLEETYIVSGWGSIEVFKPSSRCV